MTFSMPSPVELTQLKIQYQRKVGTPRASKRIELGATAPAPGSTSRASTFLSLTSERLRDRPPRVARGERVCARAADRTRHSESIATRRTGRRARDPDP